MGGLGVESSNVHQPSYHNYHINSLSRRWRSHISSLPLWPYPPVMNGTINPIRVSTKYRTIMNAFYIPCITKSHYVQINELRFYFVVLCDQNTLSPQNHLKQPSEIHRVSSNVFTLRLQLFSVFALKNWTTYNHYIAVYPGNIGCVFCYRFMYGNI